MWDNVRSLQTAPVGNASYRPEPSVLFPKTKYPGMNPACCQSQSPPVRSLSAFYNPIRSKRAICRNRFKKKVKFYSRNYVLRKDNDLKLWVFRVIISDTTLKSEK